MGRALTGLCVGVLVSLPGVASAAPPAPIYWPLEAPLTRPGETKAAGLALLRLGGGPRVCWRITVADQTALPATAARLHRDAGGQPGAVVLTFAPPKDGHSSGCEQVPQSVFDGLRHTPRAYMVVVRTANGSIRGQVRPFTRYQPGAGR